MTATTTKPALTAAQRQALIAFASRHGAGWKDKLSALWLRAAAGPDLQQVRNELGPAWLSRVTLRQIIDNPTA